MQTKKKIKFKSPRKKISFWYVGSIFIITFLLASLMAFSTDTLLRGATVVTGLVVLLTVILIGILFDVIGVAATSADDTLFHAMASDKVPGAKETIVLIKNAEKVSSFCNDVVGDICGIVSGSITTFVIATLNIGNLSLQSVYASFLLTALVSALTVGGKALGKFIAIKHNSRILFSVGRIMRLLSFLRLPRKH